ncbi:uncharacterized protein LOC111714041 [Eurytemora carolleeae]|uniref:uncharacterized protein LOC111714041 n=1 Tax=Eurytemora carolleeae TaxID=1294199 RepID=UPI000C784AEE|nr:uncharacterized protein LOC111714041 [Eurytemora carolleeae]|eukprot:XP_023344811.1 uncharacterized protein LOC111714041 [Eurytemora affinis]
MGKGPKHNLGRNRNNAIFKVAGVNMKDKKGKAKEVVSKLKVLNAKNKSKVMDLDNTLKQLQHSNALAGTSVSGKEKKDETIKPGPTKPENIKDTDMTDLAEMLKTNS